MVIPPHLVKGIYIYNSICRIFQINLKKWKRGFINYNFLVQLEFKQCNEEGRNSFSTTINDELFSTSRGIQHFGLHEALTFRLI